MLDLTPLADLTDLQLTEVALTASGRRRERAWAETMRRAVPAIPRTRRAGLDAEEVRAEVAALVYEKLEEPVENIEAFVRETVSASNIRRELAADNARRGMTGVGQRRAIAARRVARDVALLGDSVHAVWEQEGRFAPDADGLAVVTALSIARAADPASMDAIRGSERGEDFEPVVQPLAAIHGAPVRPFSTEEQAVLDAFDRLAEAEQGLMRVRYGLDGADPVEGTDALAVATGLSMREVKTLLQSARRKLRATALKAA